MGNVFGLEVRTAAYRHRYTDADKAHAYKNAIRLVEFDYHGEDQLLIMGPALPGNIIELVVVPVDDPNRIIHANDLQPSHRQFLR